MHLIVLFFSLLLTTTAVAGTQDRAERTADIIEFESFQAGSVVYANGARHAQKISDKLNLGLHNAKKVVVITGRAAYEVSDLMISYGLDVVSQGRGTKRVLVFVDGAADEILKILKHVYGAALDVAKFGIVVIKGGLSTVLMVMAEVFEGSLELGVELAKLACTLVHTTWHVVVEFARWILGQAGTIISMTVEGVILVAVYAAGTICDVMFEVADGVWEISKFAIKSVFQVVGGVIEHVRGVIRVILDLLFGHSSYGHYRVRL